MTPPREKGEIAHANLILVGVESPPPVLSKGGREVPHRKDWALKGNFIVQCSGKVGCNGGPLVVGLRQG